MPPVPPELADDHAYRALARRVAELRTGRRPVVFGVAGGVAAGKSTTAGALRRHLEAEGLRVDVLVTDAFLRPNADLERRSLTMRKGFPESYDTEALVAALRQLRSGHAVDVPVYSHLTYDRVEGASRSLDATADVVVVEGVNVLQPAVADELDASVYVDAAEPDARAWFLDRFLQLCREGADDPTSFYAPLAAVDSEARRGVADAAWEGINAVNLRDHIVPSRHRATFVLRKRADHSVASFGPARDGSP